MTLLQLNAASRMLRIASIVTHLAPRADLPPSSKIKIWTESNFALVAIANLADPSCVRSHFIRLRQTDSKC